MSANRIWHYEVDGRREGPITASELRAMKMSSEMRRDTLVWNSEVGGPWRPISEVDLSHVVRSVQPSAVSDGLAWAIAMVPILGAFAELILQDDGYLDPDSTVAFKVYSLLYAVLAFLDVSHIRGQVGTARGIGWWFWLPPVYLFKRARLLGQSLACFVTWFVTTVLAVVVLETGLIKDGIYWGATELPPCDSRTSVDQITEIFEDIPLIRFLGVTAQSVDDLKEVSHTGTVRKCVATVISSSGSVHPLDVTIETRDDQIQYVLELAPAMR